MSEVIDMKKSRSTANEVHRVDLHDSSPEFVNSKTLSPATMPNGRMTFSPGDSVIKIEYKGKIHFMPITNAKLIWMK